VRREHGAQIRDVGRGDKEVRILGVAAKQRVADRAADDVRIQPE
jgi:hypothetical protein